MINIKIGEPIPKTLRETLSEVLEKRDFAKISTMKDMASESTIRDLLNGFKVSRKSRKTVIRLINHAIKKCYTSIYKFQKQLDFLEDN